jgi:integrase
VRRLRPSQARYWRTVKLPKPLTSMPSPRMRASDRDEKICSTSSSARAQGNLSLSAMKVMRSTLCASAFGPAAVPRTCWTHARPASRRVLIIEDSWSAVPQRLSWNQGAASRRGPARLATPESARTSLRPSSIKTLEFRLRTITKGRATVPVEAFPWRSAWSEHVEGQSVDSQHGILAAADGFVSYCIKAGFVRRDPLVDVEVQGRKKRGKKQLHIDEAKRFVDEALKHADDPIALACAAMVYAGLRPGEIMGLQVRDLDAGGTVLWVEKSKTEAGKRAVEVAEVFRPFLQDLAKGRQSQDCLFDFKPERIRASVNRSRRLGARPASSTSSQSASGPARTSGNDGSMSCSVEPGRSAPAPDCQWSAPTRCEGCTALWPPGSERQGRWWPRPWVTRHSTSPSATTWTGMFWRAPVCEATFGCFKAAQAR